MDEEGEEYKQAEVTGRVKGQSTFRLASFLKRAGQVGRLINVEQVVVRGLIRSLLKPFREVVQVYLELN